MADINFIDGKIIAQYLKNDWPFSGYVLDFSDVSFAKFFADELQVDINNVKYHKHGLSKGRRLRAFFEIEDDNIVGRALRILGHYREFNNEVENEDLKSRYYTISERLIGDIAQEGFEDTIVALGNTEYWHNLSDSITVDIQCGRCEAALDRLHTYFRQYFQLLLAKKKIEHKQDEKIEIPCLQQSNAISSELAA